MATETQVGQPHLKKQDLATLDITKLTPLSPEVISRQATINIGTIGHVAHGKSTVVKAISGVHTVRFKNELERNITIKLDRLTMETINEIVGSRDALRDFIERLDVMYPPRPSSALEEGIPDVDLTPEVTIQGQKRKRSISSISPDSQRKLKQVKLWDFLRPVEWRAPRDSATPDLTFSDCDASSVVSETSSIASTSFTSNSSGGGGVTSSKRRRSRASNGSSSSKAKTVAHPPPATKDGEYVVEAILSVEAVDAKPSFQVKWKGYGSKYNTWEPLEHVQDTTVFWPFIDLQAETLFEEMKELTDEMLAGVEVMPTQEQFPLMLEEIKKLNLAELQADLICLTNIRIYASAKYPRRMYERAKHGVLVREQKKLRDKQLMRIKDFQRMINAKESSSKIRIENVVDFDSPPEDFTYVNDNVAGEGVIIPNDPPCGCNCGEGGCNYRSECCGKLNGYQFAYNAKRSVKIPRGVPIFECNKMCTCGPDCPNRIVQQGRKHKLVLFKTDDGRGWGVRTETPIPEGQFVCEYTGEIITADEAERRGKEYDANGSTYLFDLDFHSRDNLYTIDALKYGNIARFINHSCEPNCGIWPVWTNCLDPNMEKIVFFSTRRIEAGEEILIDYLNGACEQPDETFAAVAAADDSAEKENRQENGAGVTGEEVDMAAVVPADVEMEAEEKIEKKERSFPCKCGTKKCRKFIFTV